MRAVILAAILAGCAPLSPEQAQAIADGMRDAAQTRAQRPMLQPLPVQPSNTHTYYLDGKAYTCTTIGNNTTCN